MGLKDEGPYGVGGPICPLDIINPAFVVDVYETQAFTEGDGIKIQLAGGFVRVDARTEGVELTAWCTIEHLLDALCEQTKAMGS
jgi:hypothetical protein